MINMFYKLLSYSGLNETTFSSYYQSNKSRVTRKPVLWPAPAQAQIRSGIFEVFSKPSQTTWGFYGSWDFLEETFTAHITLNKCIDWSVSSDNLTDKFSHTKAQIIDILQRHLTRKKEKDKRHELTEPNVLSVQQITRANRIMLVYFFLNPPHFW